MAQDRKLNRPWLVAVWPGMGNVALNAGIYLMSKLDMSLIAEFEAGDLFDIDHVEVKSGIIQTGKRARNRLFAWTDPNRLHDIVVFIGEAQPPIGKYTFCQHLIDHVANLGVERIVTFAAMATQMHPGHASRVFGAATDEENLDELKGLELQVLEEGHIGGLNGVLLAAANATGLQGACLLGEMPHIFRQLPFPQASLAILEVFANMAGIDLDLAELREQADAMGRQLSELFERVQDAYAPQSSADEDDYKIERVEESRLSSADERHIESLFKQALNDRSKAFELKQQLDRLGIFKDYEDRFLDLFKKVS